MEPPRWGQHKMLTKLGAFSTERKKKAHRGKEEKDEKTKRSEIKLMSLCRSNSCLILLCHKRKNKYIHTHTQLRAINSAEGNKSVSSWQGSHYSYKIQTSLSYKCFNPEFIKAPPWEVENSNGCNQRQQRSHSTSRDSRKLRTVPTGKHCICGKEPEEEWRRE